MRLRDPLSVPAQYDGALPYLEYYSGRGGQPVHVVLDPLPFRVGRGKDADHVIYSKQVSKEHAEFLQDGERYVIRDLGSTNGTFVNGQRIQRCALRHGDIVHVADTEFSFGYEPESMVSDVADATVAASSSQRESLILRQRSLERLISEQGLFAVYQPIVELGDRSVVGYETLGRTKHPEIEFRPVELFQIAEEGGKAQQISRMLRHVAFDTAVALPGEKPRLFCNLHPAEMQQADLIDRLAEATQRLRPDIIPVIEIHEAAVTDVAAMRDVRDRLRELGMEIAYDDFGAGQSRLNELADVPPDFLKLDMSLIRNIDRTPARSELVLALVRVMCDLGIQVLAEGVETEGEADFCHRAGCSLAQGYLFGRPAPIEHLA